MGSLPHNIIPPIPTANNNKSFSLCFCKMSQKNNVGACLEREESIKSSHSISSSSGTAMDSTRALNLEEKTLFCNNIVREDPFGHSSRMLYYRSNVNVGEGVPFQWETQPGKPKTNNNMKDGYNVFPLSPPPSSFVSNPKQSNKKKIQAFSPGCNPFNIKKVW